MYLTNISPTWVLGMKLCEQTYHILMAKGFRLEYIGCFLWSLRFGGSQDLISTISASVSNANAAISACQRQWRQAFGTSVENLYLTFVDSDIRHRI